MSDTWEPADKAPYESIYRIEVFQPHGTAIAIGEPNLRLHPEIIVEGQILMPALHVTNYTAIAATERS